MPQLTDGATLPFEQRCADALQEIRESSGLTASHARLGLIVKGLDDQDAIFADLSENEGFPFNHEIRQYFFRFNDVECFWRTSNSDSKLVGEFNLTHFYRCIVEKQMYYTWEGENDWERELYKDLRIFDETPHGGSGKMAGLRAIAGTDNPDIWYFDIQRGPTRMDIGYGEYLDNLLVTKGTTGWQYLFCDVRLDETSVVTHRAGLAEMLETFPDLFPGHDYSQLVARYEQRL